MADTAADVHRTDTDLTITRLVDAPRDLVWRAWTEPEHLIRWWGPDGFTHTFDHCEVKVGGTWRFTMHGPDGRSYPNVIRYDELIKPERMVYTHGERLDDPSHFTATITFQEEGGKTRVTMRSVFRSKEALAFVVEHFHAVEGGRQHLGRLDAHVAAMAAGGTS